MKRLLFASIAAMLIGCDGAGFTPNLPSNEDGRPSTGALLGGDVLYRFRGGTDGRAPRTIVVDASGVIFGITQAGGGSGCAATYVRGCGTIYELTPSTNGFTESVLHRFTQTDQGVFPIGLVLHDGRLYGTTAFTWPNGCGTIFRIARTGNGFAFKTLYAFDGLGGSGCAPRSPPLVGNAGVIYGTTVGGGASGLGSIFKLTPTDGGYVASILYSFKGKSDGKWPSGTLTLEPTGDLYGTTMAGGRAGCNGTGCGTVYRLHRAASGYVEQIVHRFTAAEGSPFDGVSLADGAVYGVTGGAACGLLFEIAPKRQDSYRVLHRFGRTEGCGPDGVVADGRGDIFGTTEFGGSAKATKRCPIGCGAVFEAPSSSGYRITILHNFDGSDGEQPVSGVIVKGGMLYGTAAEGGSGCRRGYGGGGCGTVFALPIRLTEGI